MHHWGKTWAALLSHCLPPAPFLVAPGVNNTNHTGKKPKLNHSNVKSRQT